MYKYIQCNGFRKIMQGSLTKWKQNPGKKRAMCNNSKEAV